MRPRQPRLPLFLTMGLAPVLMANAAIAAVDGVVDASGDLALLPSGQVVSLPSGASFGDGGPMTALSGDSKEGCGILQNRSLWCWARNSAVQTVTGPIPGLARVVAAAGSLVEGCAAEADGRVSCWDRLAQDPPDGPVARVEVVPDFTVTEPPALERPLRVKPRTDLADVVALVEGRDGCALNRAGQVLCWGRQYERQDPALPLVAVYRARAQRIAGLPRIRQMAAHLSTRCALGENSRVYCWGHRLGQRPSTASILEAPFDERPRLVEKLTDVVHIAVHGRSFCAVRKSGRVSCRGRIPAPGPGVTNAVRVTLTLGGGCAVLGKGGLSCWGRLAMGTDAANETAPTGARR